MFLHPLHALEDCDPVNVGSLAPGERREVTWPADIYTICYFHEEGQPDRRDLQGVAVIH